MATGQLIPEWRHPSETTFIFDNTVVQDTESINTEAVTLISVFTGPKGRDNKLLKKNSLYSHVEEFGYPDYAKYGQAGYIPYTALSTGNATCWEMRVMPTDATYGHIVYAVKYRKVTISTVDATGAKSIINYTTDTAPTGTTYTTGMEVDFVPYSLPATSAGLTDAASLPVYMETLKETVTADDDGFFTVPYIGFRMLGRGDYGKYFRIRMSHDVSSDKENAYKNYTIAVLNSEQGIVQKETFPAVNLFEEAVDPKTNVTTFINEVINDIEGDGSQRIAVEFLPDYHTFLFNWYKENIDPNTEMTIETFDIFGYDRTRADKTNPFISVKNGISSVALFGVTGIKMSGGFDGSLDLTVPAATREAAADTLYQSAFSGGIDPKINSKMRAPANVCLDANYSLATKKLLIALVLARGDMLGYVDAGLVSTVAQWRTIANQLADIDSYYISKNLGMFTTRDSITGKRIPVTITMWLAYKIPMHWREKGCYTPMAGEEYAQLSGYIRNSVYPELDSDNHEILEEMYDARWNYIECFGEDTFVRGTQQTSQSELSDLSEENNVHVMLQVKRRLERLCAQKRYHFGEASDRKMFTDDAQELFSAWKGIYLRSIEISFTMSTYEELRSILHCTCNITYNTIIKRTVIEININPRA